MKKIWYMTKETLRLICTHKLYVIAPLLIALLVLTLLAFFIGPAVILPFIYTGL